MYAYTLSERINHFGIVLFLGLAMTGCSMFSDEAKLHKNAKGSVYLKEIADWSFEANHPATIDQTTMLKVLKGVVIDDRTKAQAYLPASGSKPMRIFSDEDAEFLAPLLAQGLLQAKPEQMVGFKVSPSAGSGTEPTAGTLYVHQGSIHLTLAPQDRRTAGFTPVAAARLEKAPSFIPLGRGATTMVIDYQAVAKAPTFGTTAIAAASKSTPTSSVPAGQLTPATMPAPATQLAKTAPPQEPPAESTASTEPPSTIAQSELAGSANDELLNQKLDELREAREISKMKDSEISMLKKEVAWMKQELRERAAEINTMKANKVSRPLAPKKRTAEVTPQR